MPECSPTETENDVTVVGVGGGEGEGEGDGEGEGEGGRVGDGEGEGVGDVTADGFSSSSRRKTNAAMPAMSRPKNKKPARRQPMMTPVFDFGGGDGRAATGGGTSPCRSPG